MEPNKRFLFWLLDGTRGGPMRAKIMRMISKKPMNLRQIALGAGVDYSTAEHHIRLLEKHSLVDCIGSGYGKMYALYESEIVQGYLAARAEGDGNESKKNGKE